MRFSYKFDRTVAAGGVTTLGTDAVPSDATYLTNDNVFRTKLSASEPSQRIVLAAKYTGVGVPVDMTAKAYIYDGVSQGWFTVDSYKSTLKCGDICFFGIPQIISPTQVAGGDEYVSTIDSIEWALVVDLPAGCPDGSFEFLLGLDISEVEDEIQAGHVDHVVVDSPNPFPVEDLTAENTLSKILWGQAGSTQSTGTPVVNGVKLSVATDGATAHTYSGVALDGGGMTAGALTVPSNVSVTTATHAATYKTGAGNPIVVTGTEYYTKQTVTEAFVLTAAGGGETISGVVLFDAAALTIDVPKQNDALGHFQFGTGAEVPAAQKSVVRGGAKGATTAADVTSTAHGADHQALDTTPYGSTAVGSVPAAAVKPLDLGAVIQDADPVAPGVDTQVGRLRLDSMFRLIVRAYQWTSAKGAAVAAALTSKPVAPDVQALDTWDSAPTHATYNYSTSRGDAPAVVRASDNTLTWSGPTITSGQLCRVRVITTTTARPLVWEQGRNAVLTISGATITVSSLDGTVATIPAAATTVEVMWTAQDKSYDPATNAQRNVPMYSDALRNFPQDCSQTTSLAGGTTTSFYLPGGNINDFTIQWYSSAGTYAKTLKVYATDQDDSSVALGSLNFNDVTADWFGAATINCAAGTVTSVAWLGKNTPTTCAWIRIDVTVAAGATVDNQWVIYTRRKY